MDCFRGIGRTVCSRNRLSTGLVQSFQLSPDIPNRLDLLEELLLLPIQKVVVAFVSFVEIQQATEFSVAALPVLLFLLLDFSSGRRDTPASGAETALVKSGMLPPYMLTAKLVSASCAMVEGGIVPFRGSRLGLYVQEQPRLFESFSRLAHIGAHAVGIGKWARETTSGDLSPVVPIRRHMLPAAAH